MQLTSNKPRTENTAGYCEMAMLSYSRTQRSRMRVCFPTFSQPIDLTQPITSFGDGRPVSFIGNCAVPLLHLAEHTDALTNVFRKHGSKDTWHAYAAVSMLDVRQILGLYQGRGHGGAAKMRALAEEALALVRHFTK